MFVLACEGPCEVQLMNKLLNDGVLLFSVKDILDRRPIHLRQPRLILPLVNTLDVDTEITIYRIGDTQKDGFDISCFGQIRKDHIKVVKVCTKPEIEILVIISEGLYEAYLKVKSKQMPKQFVKEHLRGYSSFIDYISVHDMVPAIKEYKRIKQNHKNELYLADLLKS